MRLSFFRLLRNPGGLSYYPTGHIIDIVLPPNPYIPRHRLALLAAGAIEDETRLMVSTNMYFDGNML